LNLIVDIGNTRIKAAVFAKSQLLKLYTYDDSEQFLAALNIVSKDSKQALVCTVVNDSSIIYNRLTELMPTLQFTSATPVPLINLYQTAFTLGSDRLAAAVGSANVFPNCDVLTIDTGTCIKYNFLTANNEYIGGAIAPGLKMRLKALHQLTSRLPLVDFDATYSQLIGKNTHDSILSGSLLGAVFEVDATIEAYKKEFPNLKVIVSGGDTDFFAKRLKNSIFASPTLVLEGLNKILEYNVHK
jgi:type III pantothenate kinase